MKFDVKIDNLQWRIFNYVLEWRGVKSDFKYQIFTMLITLQFIKNTIFNN